MKTMKKNSIFELSLSLLVQTLNNFMQIKVKALGHGKKTIEQVVLPVTPRQFHKILL